MQRIQVIMPMLLRLLIAATLLLCGVYAGLVLMTRIGVLPGLRLLSPWAFAEAWVAMDRFMGRSMPPFKAVMLLVSLAATLVAAWGRQTALSTALGFSFLFSLAGLILTVRKQLPLSAQLRELPRTSPEAVLVAIRDETIRNIDERVYLALLAFALPCVAMVFNSLR